MESAIKNFASQFEFLPTIQNEEGLEKWPRAESFVLCGMGGSHLAAGLLKINNPSLDMYIHRDYGLPIFAEKRHESTMYIASSYSGNTEEVLDFAEKALQKNFNVVAIATGGELLDWAKKHSLPYIELPNTGIQPRSALGFSVLALAKFLEGGATGSGEGDVDGSDKNSQTISNLQKFGRQFNPLDFESAGRGLAENLRGKVPIIYSSRQNLPIAYNWKIKFNETAKIPAFYNVFPELNHNEMVGFDVLDSARSLSEKFHFIFLTDQTDHPKIIHRMAVCKKMYEDRGFRVTEIALVSSSVSSLAPSLAGESVFAKIFNSLILADWTALALSEFYGTDPEKVAMIEEFKKEIGG